MALDFEDAGGEALPCHFPALLAGGITVVVRGSLFAHDGARFHFLPSAVVGGPRTAPLVLHRTPRLSCVGLLLRPAATASVLQASPAALVDGLASLEDAFDADWRGHAQRFADSGDHARRVEVLFDVVRARVRATHHLERKRRALELQQLAMQPLRDAASHSGITRRQFERIFSASLGVRPKLFQRIARTEAALRDMLSTGRCDADLAQRHGYYDQSHLGRDLRALAGAGPSALLAQVRTPGTTHWPLAIGATYAAAGLRPDFAAA